MAGADRLNKEEVLEVVEEDGGGHIKNFSLYPRSNGKPFVSFTVLKTITKMCVLSTCLFTFLWWWWWGVPFLWVRDHVCLVYHCIPSTYTVENQQGNKGVHFL